MNTTIGKLSNGNSTCCQAETPFVYDRVNWKCQTVSHISLSSRPTHRQVNGNWMLQTVSKPTTSTSISYTYSMEINTMVTPSRMERTKIERTQGCTNELHYISKHLNYAMEVNIEVYLYHNKMGRLKNA